MLTRVEHLAWAKKRALAELDRSDPNAISNAIASMISDCRKHPDLESHPGLMLFFFEAGHRSRTRRWIEGFE